MYTGNSIKQTIYELLNENGESTNNMNTARETTGNQIHHILLKKKRELTILGWEYQTEVYVCMLT